MNNLRGLTDSENESDNSQRQKLERSNEENNHAASNQNQDDAQQMYTDNQETAGFQMEGGENQVDSGSKPGQVQMTRAYMQNVQNRQHAITDQNLIMQSGLSDSPQAARKQREMLEIAAMQQ